MAEARAFQPAAGPFEATVTVPGDKSLGHRALVLAALAEGESVVGNLPPGQDVESTRAATELLGVEYKGSRITSPGRPNWSAPSGPIDCGNSGTTMRLLTGAIAGSCFEATLVGDFSLMRRPMRRLVPPLSALGADITVATSGTPPIEVRGVGLRGASVTIPMASAQVRTAVALAALAAVGPTQIESPPGFRDHTERWLAQLGLGRIESPTTFIVAPKPVPPLDLSLPADPSSAALLWAAAAVTPGSRVVTPGISLNPGRTGFLEVLELMGARVMVEPGAPIMGDPVGTVSVESGRLSGVEVAGELVVRSLDELPLLAIVAAAAEGPTVVAEATEARAKESDRIASSVELARVAGAEARAEPDGFVVTPKQRKPGPGRIDAAGDHRVAMAAAIAPLIRGSTVTVAGFEAADVSWPDFGDALEGMWL